MWQVYVLLGVVTGIVAYLWVSGISNTHKSHPDYKGNQDGFDFDHDLKDWDVTIADGLDKLEEKEMKPIHKFNNGRGAMLCNICRAIISIGSATEELLCEKCKQKQHLIDIMEKDEELGLYDIFNDEKRQGVKELIDKHKQEAALKEALLELRKTPMTFEPEQETLEKYSERFDNDKSEIGNPDTWGKRVVEEAAYEYAEPYRCPATNENEYCKHDIISAFNNGAKWQAERSYSEEDMNDYANYRLLIKKALSPKEWFELNKKRCK